MHHKLPWHATPHNWPAGDRGSLSQSGTHFPLFRRLGRRDRRHRRLLQPQVSGASRPGRPRRFPQSHSVEGPLNPKVVFPERNQVIGVRDSNFIFGSVGNGHAKLTINGTSVPVAPNGTFLAYLPVPPRPRRATSRRVPRRRDG